MVALHCIGDDDVGDDKVGHDNIDNTGDIYIMMQCLFVCHEK